MSRSRRKVIREIAKNAYEEVVERFVVLSGDRAALRQIVDHFTVPRPLVARALGVSLPQLSQYKHRTTTFPKYRRGLTLRPLLASLAGAELACEVLQSRKTSNKHVRRTRKALLKAVRAEVELAKCIWEQEMGFDVRDPENSSYPAIKQELAEAWGLSVNDDEKEATVNGT